MSALFINSKLDVLNGLGKLRNSPYLLVIFVVVPFIKIPLFSKGLIIFIIFFISLFVRVTPEPVIYSFLSL